MAFGDGCKSRHQKSISVPSSNLIRCNVLSRSSPASLPAASRRHRSQFHDSRRTTHGPGDRSGISTRTVASVEAVQLYSPHHACTIFTNSMAGVTRINAKANPVNNTHTSNKKYFRSFFFLFPTRRSSGSSASSLPSRATI